MSLSFASFSAASMTIQSGSRVSTPLKAGSRDVSEDVARELQRRADLAFEDLPSYVADFVDRQLGSDRERQLSLSLVA